MHEAKVLAIVFHVAAHAVPAIGIFHPQQSVVSLMRGQTVRDFLVALKALECWRAGSKLVAGVALGRPIEGLVRLRERPGRNLGANAGGAEYKTTENQ